MNNSYNNLTLSRCQTPNSTLGSANRPSPSPKCFGRNTHILKEDYERERIRWQQKLEEAEQKLTETSINNSELFQIKAELNRKIIDFEKNQRPLIEQNRRLNDRIRTLNAEFKKLEEKLAYAQDDFLSLRDTYDRLIKENSLLKEQRAFPEKLEELGRYRSQVLEYSKCITALRQSAIEKDRRYELLVQKFKKFRKCLNSKRNDLSEDDRQSYIGSEGSMDSSSICLDTIAEDLDEEIDLSSTELFHASMSPMEYSLKQQLDLANMTIIELQGTIENMRSNQQFESTNRIDDQIRELKNAKKLLETELANSQHQNELLEFQLTELTEGSQCASDFFDKQCSTTFEMAIENEFQSIDYEIRKRLKVSLDDSVKASRSLFKLLHDTAVILNRNQFDTLKNGIEILDALQNQYTFAETELNMANCELNRLKRKYNEEIAELKKENEDSTTKKQQKKKELQIEIEQLKKEKKDEAKRTGSQLQELQIIADEKSKEIVEKIEQIEKLNCKISEMSNEINNQASIISSNETLIFNLKENINLQNDCNKKEMFAALEMTQRDSEEKIKALTIENSNFKSLLESNKNDLNQINNALTNFKLKHNTEQSNLEAHYQKTLQKSIEDANEEQKKIEADKLNLERDLSDAKAQIASLKEQIRPIGSQLERRYEESRFRLTEALKKNYQLEKQVAEANDKIKYLKNFESIKDKLDSDKNIIKIKQLEAYSRGLEEQFNSQMDIIAALKNKLIKGNTQSTDSIGWTSNSSEGTNSLDDEHYHSEGSDSGRIIIKGA